MPTRRRRRASLSATRVDVGVCVFLTFGASSRCPWADRSRDRFPLKEGYRKHNGIVRAGVQADDGRKGLVCWAHAAGYCAKCQLVVYMHSLLWAEDLQVMP